MNLRKLIEDWVDQEKANGRWKRKFSVGQSMGWTEDADFAINILADISVDPPKEFAKDRGYDLTIPISIVSIYENHIQMNRNVIAQAADPKFFDKIGKTLDIVDAKPQPIRSKDEK